MGNVEIRRFGAIFLSVALVFACRLSCCQTETVAGELHRYDATESHMGTAFTIVLYAQDITTANHAFKGAFARIAELDRRLSDYSAESEISRLSRSSPHPEPVKVSHDVWTVLSHSARRSAETDGAFDVTVGPLTKLWRRARRRGELPPADLLKAARSSVGYDKLRLDEQRRMVQLTSAGMRIDLGGVAKGYALDEVLRTLRSHDIDIAFVNGGGDIAVSDSPPTQDGWRVELAGLQPDVDATESILLRNAAVATSGDAWQFVEIDGQRYSHLIDPKTGIGLSSRRTVSVIARTGIEADSLASSISVLGLDQGLALVAAKADIEARIITIRDGRVHDLRSNGFQQWLQPPKN